MLLPAPVSADEAASALTEAGAAGAHQTQFLLSQLEKVPSAAPGVPPGLQPAGGLGFHFPQFLGLVRLGFWWGWTGRRERTWSALQEVRRRRTLVPSPVRTWRLNTMNLCFLNEVSFHKVFAAFFWL